MTSYPLTPIAFVQSPFREKFATPRQPGLAPSIEARVVFLPEYSAAEAIRGLEGFSHIWLLFLFHQNHEKSWTPTVRPPRLGGNKRVGVFASRSPFRPNPLGLSAVELLSIDSNGGETVLSIRGADLIHGTPVLDIKPYIPYGDSIPDARDGFIDGTSIPRLEVIFTEQARRQLAQYLPQAPALEQMIRETLCLDPRPAYRQGGEDRQDYGIWLDNYNIRWLINANSVIVTQIEERRA